MKGGKVSHQGDGGGKVSQGNRDHGGGGGTDSTRDKEIAQVRKGRRVGFGCQIPIQPHILWGADFK